MPEHPLYIDDLYINPYACSHGLQVSVSRSQHAEKQGEAHSPYKADQALDDPLEVLDGAQLRHRLNLQHVSQGLGNVISHHALGQNQVGQDLAEFDATSKHRGPRSEDDARVGRPCPDQAPAQEAVLGVALLEGVHNLRRMSLV
jgi:hypothetical protein